MAVTAGDMSGLLMKIAALTGIAQAFGDGPKANPQQLDDILQTFYSTMYENSGSGGYTGDWDELFTILQGAARDAGLS